MRHMGTNTPDSGWVAIVSGTCQTVSNEVIRLGGLHEIDQVEGDGVTVELSNSQARYAGACPECNPEFNHHAHTNGDSSHTNGDNSLENGDN